MNIDAEAQELFDTIDDVCQGKHRIAVRLALFHHLCCLMLDISDKDEHDRCLAEHIELFKVQFYETRRMCDEVMRGIRAEAH
jgi:hypothetical protein